ncbi:gamma-aminobutyric acid receptor subunit beta-3-like isoform X2 [Convolutriloba macropyga]|uniref:gamma-aminobutyric acid receptor subunit beta-3-like isoform X2 n=1 Tax=Convolutriloba macropyga TaxID=536237 RepID=UPI003F51CC4D
MLFMAFVSFIGFLLPGSSLQQGEKSDTRARMEREKSLNTTSSNLEYVKIASSLISTVSDVATYNKLLRPYFGGEPVVVYTSIVIDGIGPVSHEEMEFTMDFFFRQKWLDPRLAYTNSSHPYIQFGSEISDKIWKPDTYFLSAVRTSVHAGGSVNSLIRIHPEGLVLVSERLRVTSKCFMVLEYFPLDTQKCSLLVGSYGYTEDDIKYSWFLSDPVSFNDDISTIQIPQFKYQKLSRRIATHQLSTGNYSYAQLSIYLERNIAVFVVQVYLPAALIVTISWVTFWVKRNAVPARASIGVTAVLTMMTLTAGGVLRDPRFTEVTPMDIYIGVCFMYVVAALVEMAFVGYFDKPRYNRQPPSRRPPQPPVGSSAFGQIKHTSYLPIGITMATAAGQTTSDHNSDGYTSESHQKASISKSPEHQQLNQQGFSPFQKSSDSRSNGNANTSPSTGSDVQFTYETTDQSQSRPHHENNSTITCECYVSAPRIDIFSRVTFPLTFFIFNVFYWILFIHQARKASSRLDLTS